MIASPIRQAFVLVGGRGQRLGSLTGSTPKPMLEVAGRPFLTGLIQELVRQGISEITLLAGYLGEQIAREYHGRYFGNAFCRVVIESEPIGTGGALRTIQDLAEQRFLVLNGDSFVRFSLFDLERFHDKCKCRHAMVGVRVDDVSRYGALKYRGERVVAISEKGRTGPGQINCGVYLFDRSVFDLVLPSGFQSLESTILPQLVESGQLAGLQSDGYFIDIGLTETLAEAQTQMLPFFRSGAVFFDRDGVLNGDLGYVHDWERFEWLPGAREAVSRVVESGRIAFVVTNQAGIARGFYAIDDMLNLHRQMNESLRQGGGYIAQFYFSPFHRDATKAAFRIENHPRRKPDCGMMLQAARDWAIDLEDSALFGDTETDVAAGRSAGIGKSFLVAPGELLDKVERVLAG